MKFAHFAFYPQDWMASNSIRAMSLQGEAIYMRLLCAMWGSEGAECSLPDDDRLIAKLIRVRIDVWRRLRPEIMPALDRVNGGRLSQERLRAEWVRAKERYDRTVAARAKSRTKVELKSDKSPTKVEEKSDFLEARPANLFVNPSSDRAENQNQNQNQKLLNNVGPEDAEASAAPTSAGVVALFPEQFPERLSWVVPILDRHNAPGFLRDPRDWIRLEKRVDSWGEDYATRFASSLEAILVEYLDWQGQLTKKHTAFKGFQANADRWHDREVSKDRWLLQKGRR